MIDKKGLAKGIATLSLILVVATVAGVFLLNYAVPVLAAHEATVKITPNIANCSQLGNTFTVNVKNNGASTDKILQVEIYKAIAGLSNFVCGDAPSGWTLFSYTDRCIYVTGLNSPDKIAPGNSLNFTFDATMSSGSCTSDFIVVTVDDAIPGVRNTYHAIVNIDCIKPDISKVVGDPKIWDGGTFDWWVREDTLIEIEAHDSTSTNSCNLGLDYCRWRVTVDGVVGGWNYEDNDTVNDPLITWDFDFDGDSNHYLEVECYDNAGNKEVLTELDKVDDTPPITQKTVSDPKKIENGVEWIDTETTVGFYPHDPDSTGHSCNIGVDKTWYLNYLWCVEDPCWSPTNCGEAKTHCPSPYDNQDWVICVNDAQLWCDEHWDDPENNPPYCSWAECVEKRCPMNCDGFEWKLYDGTPINKDEESCHVLYYFSVDHLGNVEDMNVNCFFVDKTPPMINKYEGDAIEDLGEPAFMNEGNLDGSFHWLTSDMPIVFTCDDTKLPTGGDAPHPAEGEKLCFKVSYDYVYNEQQEEYEWGYITQQYCDKYSGVMNNEEYCCVPVEQNVQSDFYKNFVFDFDEETMHNLEYYCRDAVLKDTDVHIQYYKVDDTPPETTKTYEPDLYVDGNTKYGDTIHDIILESEDQGDVCVSGLDKIYYRVRVLKNPNNWHYCYDGCYDWNGIPDHLEAYQPAPWLEYVEPFGLSEESCNVIEYYAVDNVGNEEEIQRQCVFYDATPPVTEKTYGTPVYPAEGYPKWIDSTTEITLTPEDPEPHPSGVKETYYRYFLVEDSNCYPDGYCGPMQWNGDEPSWQLWDGIPFTIDEESCHQIEYYSVDNVGKEECIKRQCVFVENTAPTLLEKQIGEPKVFKNDKWYISGQTPITISCEDQGDHPVDHVSIWYRYRYAEDCDDLSSAIFGDWITAPSVVKASSSSMRFSSTGWGGWSCPEGTVVVGGGYEPYPANYPVAHSLAWKPGACVDSVCWPNTPFGYTYSEGETGWIVQNGGEAQDLTVYAICAAPITFPEDSCHELEYYCVDALGHESEHEFEIDVVDNQAPEITKTIDGPWTGDCLPEDENDYCYIDGVTKIHVEATDPEPHPVNDVLCSWDYEVLDGENQGVTGGEQNLQPPFDIQFPEESMHGLRIVCWDALGNKVEDQERFFVDKTPPEIKKNYGKPFYDEEVCVRWEKPKWWLPEECVEWKTVEWISSDTKIKISVEDAGPHKSGIKESKYRYDIVDDAYCWGTLDCETLTLEGKKEWTIMSDPAYEKFYIGEESCHLIEIMSTDNVEKSSTHKQCVFVDNRGPDTVKSIGEPKDEWYPGQPGEPESYFYPEETARCWDETGEEIECWEVTTVTPLRMECDDSWDGDDTHPVGEKKLCFKVDVDGKDKTLRYCMEYGGWYNLFGDHKGECCRYLEPDEDDHDGCDFYDYKDDCDEVQDLECYEGRKVFYFLEETEHNLQYYCVDRLGNEGPVDEEKFKVEGTKLEIPLYKKWNLISVPFTLLNDDPEVVFDKVFWKGELVDDVSEYIHSVWAYDPDHVMCGQDWCVWSPDGEDNDDLKVMPGWGYWVMLNDKPDCEGILDCFWSVFNERPLWLVIGGSLFSPATTPPSRNLQKGWNLIGYYGTNWQIYPMSDENFMCGEEFQMPERYIFGDKVYCSLNSLIDTQEGYPRWSSLWSFVNCGNHDAEWVGLNTCADPDNPVQTMLSRMYAGRGYWLELDLEDMYAPATTCLWNDDFECVWTGGPIAV